MSEWMKETNLGKLQLSATLSAMPLIRCIQINGGRCKRATCLPSSISESVRERGHSLFALARLEARWRLRKLLRRLTGGFCATLSSPPCRFQAREKPCCVFTAFGLRPPFPLLYPLSVTPEEGNLILEGRPNWNLMRRKVFSVRLTGNQQNIALLRSANS